jgi:hypothetical protein
MDGRDLSCEICQKWNMDTTLLEVTHNIPKFITRVLNSKLYNYYGKFHLGAIYDLKNFNNMLVSKSIYQYYYDQTHLTVNLKKIHYLIIKKSRVLLMKIVNLS